MKPMRKMVKYFVLVVATCGAALVYFPARYGVIEIHEVGTYGLVIPGAESWLHGGTAVAILLGAVVGLLIVRSFFGRHRSRRHED